MIYKDWYMVSDSQGRASYLSLADVAAEHLRTDGYDVHLVEEPVRVPGEPLRTPPDGWMEVEVRENLKSKHDCTIRFVEADFLYQDINPQDLMMLYALSVRAGAPTRWSEGAVAFGFVVRGDAATYSDADAR